MQGALANAFAPAPGSEFVETVEDEGEDAEEGVDDEDQVGAF